MNKKYVLVGSAVGIALIIIGLALYFTVFKTTPEPGAINATSTPSLGIPVHEVVGASVQGRTIDAYTYGTGATNLLFVGGVHGGYEWNSVLLAYTFMDYLEKNPSVIPASISITVIPSANPDGVFAVIGKEGRFALADVPAVASGSAGDVTGKGRFNATGVDLNRNFACNWQATSTWRSRAVSGGTSAFSEPESKAIRDVVALKKPALAVFWHSQSNAVYASECGNGILQGTRSAMNAYSTASGYPAVDTFDAYPVTGDAEGWLASIGVPAITVELSTHATIEWEKNKAGVQALLKYFGQ